MNEILKFNDVSYFYQTKNDEIFALNKITFNVLEEDFVSIVGPSGCGKTTILSLIAGLLKPSSGKVILDGSEKSTPKKLDICFNAICFLTGEAFGKISPLASNFKNLTTKRKNFN